MSERYPGLGGDPVPGDVDEVHRLARETGRASAELEALTREVARLVDLSASWRGGAAGAFASSVAPLPERLRAAADAFGAAARRLAWWALELEGLQGEARALERQALDALDRLQRARAAEVVVSPVGGVLLAPAGDGADSAAAEEDLRRVTARADDLRRRWRAGAHLAAASLRAVAEAAPPLPADLGELVWRHRSRISSAVDLCSVASVPAVFVPAVGPLLSAGLTGVAVTGQAALATYADGSRADVALGATGLGLAGGALALGRAARVVPGLEAGVLSVARRLDDAGFGIGVHGAGTTVARRLGDGPQAAQSPPPGRPGSPTPAAGRRTGPPSPALRRLLVTPVDPGPTEPARPR